MSSNEILRLENVSKFYKTANNVAIGIRKVNASFHMGEFVIITGASGSGKSTLLNVLSGMTSYEEGVMYINGEDSSYYGHNEYEKYRKDYIACIFQNYNIIDSYSVYENIELALIARGVKKEERKPLILDVAKKVGIDHRLKNKVTRLSGGEKQRTAIARALVSDAPILVCDEITGNLDHDTSIEIIKLLHSLSQDKLVLMVTHDPEEVMQYATRVISMYDGSIQSDKVLKEVGYTETVKIKDTKPIKKSEIVHLALKSFKNTPKKSILLVLILLLATIFIGFACASVNSTSNSTNWFGYYTSQQSYDKKRIVVKRQDNAILNDADYNYFRNIDNVRYVYKNNFVIDDTTHVNYRNYDEDIYLGYDCFIYNSEMLTDDMLTIGKLPQGKEEVVIETVEANYAELKRILNGEITCGDWRISFKAKLVGIIITKDAFDSKIYISNEQFDKYQETILFSANHVSTSVWLGNSSDVTLVSNTLPNNSITVYSNYEMWGEKPVKTNIMYNEDGERKTLNDVPISYKFIEQFDDMVTDSGVDIANYFNNMEECYSTAIVLARDLFDTITTASSSETSIYVTDVKYANTVQSTLNANGYIAVVAYYEKTDETGSILTTILSVFIYLFCIALAGVIYLLSHLSLKNVIYSERKDLLIMRSLGISARQVGAQIYIKLVGVSMITTICFLVTSILLHGVYFPSSHILYAISRMHVLEMIYMVLIMLGMTFLLARKFAKNIFKSNIASKDREELQ